MTRWPRRLPPPQSDPPTFDDIMMADGDRLPGWQEWAREHDVSTLAILRESIRRRREWFRAHQEAEE